SVSALAQRPPATPSEAKQEQAQISRLTAEQTAAKLVYGKHPRDAAVRRKYVDSTVNLGVLYVNAKSVPPKIQYRTALHLFREALKIDASNKVANEWRNQIEAIYRS